LSTRYKDKKEQENIQNILDKYDYIKSDEIIKNLIQAEQIPRESILFLATTYQSNGDFNEAIKIYLALMQKPKNRQEQILIMQHLATSYFKSGFMQRSSDLFIKILRIEYSNTYALNYLSLIYEKLKDYKSALEIIEPLYELNQPIKKLKEYLELQNLIYSKLDNKDESIINHIIINKELSRVAIEYFLKFNIQIIWKNIEIFDFKNSLDLFWFLSVKSIDIDTIKKNNDLQELFSARGLIDDFKHEVFEYQILSSLNQNSLNIADISYEYICDDCKHISPLYLNRCPHCQSLLSLMPKPMITKLQNFNDITF